MLVYGGRENRQEVRRSQCGINDTPSVPAATQTQQLGHVLLFQITHIRLVYNIWAGMTVAEATTEAQEVTI